MWLWYRAKGEETMHEMPGGRTTLFLAADSANGEPLWQPRADIYRTREGWLVKLELAGVRPEDTTIWAHGSCLTIRGSRRDRLIKEDWNCYAMEISYSRFERCITLPCNIEAAHIAVKCHDGMLLVHVAAEGTQR
jgi:HSP20 family protein